MFKHGTNCNEIQQHQLDFIYNYLHRFLNKIFAQFFNSLWPSDMIGYHRTFTTLVQVKTFCLTAPSHYLNQFGLAMRYSGIHSRVIFIWTPVLKNINCQVVYGIQTFEITATFPKRQWVKNALPWMQCLYFKWNFYEIFSSGSREQILSQNCWIDCICLRMTFVLQDISAILHINLMAWQHVGGEPSLNRYLMFTKDTP